MLAKQVYHTACRISYRVSDISLKYTTKGNGVGFCVWKKGGGKAKAEKQEKRIRKDRKYADCFFTIYCTREGKFGRYCCIQPVPYFSRNTTYCVGNKNSNTTSGGSGRKKYKKDENCERKFLQWKRLYDIMLEHMVGVGLFLPQGRSRKTSIIETFLIRTAIKKALFNNRRRKW